MKSVLLVALLLLSIQWPAHAGQERGQEGAHRAPPVHSGPATRPAAAPAVAASASLVANSAVTVNVANASPARRGRAPGASAHGASGQGGAVPDLLAPALAAGSSCAVGASSGLALSGFGVFGGGNWEAKGCERRATAVIFANLGRPDVAVELLCENMDVRYAMVHAGTPCKADRERFEALAR